MELNAEILGVISGIASSLLSVSVGYGILRNKVDRIEKDLAECVSLDIFNVTVGSLKEDLHSIKDDVKELLRTVQRQEQK